MKKTIIEWHIPLLALMITVNFILLIAALQLGDIFGQLLAVGTIFVCALALSIEEKKNGN